MIKFTSHWRMTTLTLKKISQNIVFAGTLQGLWRCTKNIYFSYFCDDIHLNSYFKFIPYKQDISPRAEVWRKMQKSLFRRVQRLVKQVPIILKNALLVWRSAILAEIKLLHFCVTSLFNMLLLLLLFFTEQCLCYYCCAEAVNVSVHGEWSKHWSGGLVHLQPQHH